MFDHLQTLLLDMSLPFDLKNGNDGQGKGWHRSAKMRKFFGASTAIPTRTPFESPTFVVVTRILGRGQHMMDYDNIARGDWKQLQDALAAEKGWWFDDTAEHITGIIFRQDNTDRGSGPAVRIQVWQSGDGPVSHKNRRTNKLRKGGSKNSARAPVRTDSRSRGGRAKRKL